MFKTEFQTFQKGDDSIDKYLSRLKSIRDQLIAAGEKISENDLIIATLTGLPREYAIILTIILARESSISLKEFQAQLLNIERDIEGMENTLSHFMAAMYMRGPFSSNFNTNGPRSSTYRNSYGGSQGGGFKKFYNRGKGSNFNQRQRGWQPWSGNNDTRFTIQHECQICQRIGHTALNCFYRHPNSTPNLSECQIRGKHRHIALECYHRGNFAYQCAHPPAFFKCNQTLHINILFLHHFNHHLHIPVLLEMF